MILIFDADGKCLEKVRTSPAPPLSRYADEYGIEAVYTAETEDAAITDPNVKASDITATVDTESGAVTAVEVVEEAVLPEIFLHLGIEAPGTGPTGTPSVAMGETATLTAAMRETAAEDSAVVPYSGTVRAPYYQNGAYHGELRMVFAAGLCTLAFSPQPHNHGKLTVNEDEIGELNGYKIRVVGSTELIVDQVSAA